MFNFFKGHFGDSFLSPNRKVTECAAPKYTSMVWIILSYFFFFRNCRCRSSGNNKNHSFIREIYIQKRNLHQKESLHQEASSSQAIVSPERLPCNLCLSSIPLLTCLRIASRCEVCSFYPGPQLRRVYIYKSQSSCHLWVSFFFFFLGFDVINMV